MAKTKKEPVEVVVVIDRSGSMQTIAKDAIGGFNTFLKEQQDVKGAANMTVILFDHEHLVLADAVPIADVKPLDTKTYIPRGNTALNDAIGRALATLDAKAPKKAIVCILTDGQENSSREYTAAQIKERITKSEANGWQFVYLSASPTAFADGGALGINAANLQRGTHDSKGTHELYASMSARSTNYRNAS